MPTTEILGGRDRGFLMDCARSQVRAKYPGLLEGSSGWHRAVRSRYNRLRA